METTIFPPHFLLFLIHFLLCLPQTTDALFVNPKTSDSTCTRDCFHFKAYFLLFLSNDTPAAQFSKLKWMIGYQEESCDLLRLSYSISVYEAGNQTEFVCCDPHSCAFGLARLKTGTVLISDVTKESDDPADKHGMFDIVFHALEAIPPKRRAFDSVYLITDYAVNAFTNEETLTRISPYLESLTVIVLDPTIVSFYPKPVVFVDEYDPGRSTNFHPMCTQHYAPHNQLYANQDAAIGTDELCAAPGNYSDTGVPVDLQIFAAFSQHVSEDNFVSVKQLFASILSVTGLENNNGRIYARGPRNTLLANCRWSTYKKCITDINRFKKEFIQVDTGPINHQDLEFAPDVLNYLRFEALKTYQQRKVFMLIVSDFVSTEFPLNSLFFHSALTKQDIALTMAVVSEWNNLSASQVYQHYGSLTEKKNIYSIPCYQNISQLSGSIFNATLSKHNQMNSTTTTLVPEVTLTESESETSLTRSIGSKTTRQYHGQPPDATTASSATTPMEEPKPPTAKYSQYALNDVIIVVELSNSTTYAAVESLRATIAHNVKDCVSEKRRFGLVLPKPEDDFVINLCEDYGCFSECLDSLITGSISPNDETVVGLEIARLLLKPNPQDATKIPKLLLVTDFVSSAFIESYEEVDPLRQRLSDVDLQILLINDSDELYKKSSLPSRQIHQFINLDEFGKTSEKYFCTRPRHMSLVWICIIAISSAMLFIALFVILLICYRKNRNLIRKNKVMWFHAQHSQQSTDCDSIADIIEKNRPETVLGISWILSQMQTDPWELERQNIVLNTGHVLGRGQTGLVYRGTLRGKAPVESIHRQAFFAFHFDSCKVAVKTIPESATEKDRNSFLDEINIMKTIQPHPNVCKLLGCATVYSPLCMVLEYAEKGDLKAFLTGKRFADCITAYCSVHDDHTLCLKDLVSFCCQISEGMKFLHDVGILHRDLAARNILVKNDRVVLISDFGLAIRKDDEKVKEGRLPVKWTAPEVFEKKPFTEKADVWSFGVCIWEIFSLGAEPFPYVLPTDFLPFLLSGKRLDQPKHCPLPIWKLAESCWTDDPTARPTFAQLRAALVDNLEDLAIGYDYIELQAPKARSNYRRLASIGELPEPDDY